MWISLLLLAFGIFGANGLDHRLAGKGDIVSVLKTHGRIFSPGTLVYLPGSPEFFNVTERWTTSNAPTFSASISPATEADVVKIVKLAARYGIPFLTAGGRHSYTTTIGAFRNGLQIDMGQLNTLRVNRAAQTLTVGPGVRGGQVFDPLYDAGLEIQTGSAPCTGFIGVSLGGGVGRYQGVYGLLTDALVSARLVTASGRVLQLSKNSNPDLFWAVRGAGANFGIITSATYKARPLTDGGDNFLAEFLVPADARRQYLQTIEAMQPLPAPLSSIMLNNFNRSTGETQLMVQWVYKGSEEKARAALAPVLGLNLTTTALRVVKWNRLVESAFGGNVVEPVCAKSVNRDLFSWNLKNYSASSYSAAFTKMEKYFNDYPGTRDSVLQYEFFPNQAMAAVPSDETAFPWRDTTGYINLNLVFDATDAALREASTAFGRDLRADLVVDSGYPELTSFVNYARGDEKIERIYGPDKLCRLAALKKKWDPKHMFSYNNGIPTSCR